MPALIDYQCPACDARHAAPDHLGGTKAACPSCGQRLQLPTSPSCTYERVEFLAPAGFAAAAAAAEKRGLEWNAYVRQSILLQMERDGIASPPVA
jgi:hypothetical protein